MNEIEKKQYEDAAEAAMDAEDRRIAEETGMVPLEEILFARAPIPVKEYLVVLGGWNVALGKTEVMLKRVFSTAFMELVRSAVH